MPNNVKRIIRQVIISAALIYLGIQPLLERKGGLSSTFVYIIGLVMAFFFICIQTRFDYSWIYKLFGATLCSIVMTIGMQGGITDLKHMIISFPFIALFILLAAGKHLFKNTDSTS